MATDYKPRSPISVLVEFLESSIYKDFLGEIDTRIEDLRDFLEVGDGKKFHETRGAAAFARQIRDVFSDMMENRKADVEEEERNRNA